MAFNNSPPIQTVTQFEDAFALPISAIPEILHSTGDVFILTSLLTHCVMTGDVYLRAIIRIPAWILLAIICSNNLRLQDERCAVMQEICRLGIIMYYGLKLNFSKFLKVNSSKDKLVTASSGEPTTTSGKRDRTLSDEEVQRFYKGVPTLQRSNGPVAYCTLPYDKMLEIHPTQFTVYKTQRCLTGHNGMSFPGMMDFNNKKIRTSIKTNIPGDMKSLRALMKEIKLLKYVGQHDNLQTILGSYTKEIPRGKLYMVLENCGCHTLGMHLQVLRQEVTITQLDAYSEDLLVDFYRWAYEISSGMKFISSKGIVHGMLTCDCILLDEVGTVKLVDYGTVPHLSDSERFCPEEWDHDGWKYLAPEAIVNQEFTTSGDVWSFGIVLWKIFTIFSVPYPLYEKYSKIFSLSLLDGMRPAAEERIPQYILDLLGKCWQHEPQKRPTFDMCCQDTYVKTKPKRRVVTVDGDFITDGCL